jgi:hypothetical protein
MGSQNSNVLFTSNTTNTTNTDKRSALQDSVYVGDGSTSYSNTSSVTYAADAAVLQTLASAIPDAAVALGQLSATTLRDVGGSVVNLQKDSLAANSKAWDSTLQFGSAALDKEMEMFAQSMGIAAGNVKAGTDLASKAIDAFTPTENKNADIGKYAMWAAAAVALAVLLWKK